MLAQTQTKLLERVFLPKEFKEMRSSDPANVMGRYESIWGKDSAKAIQHVGWTYFDNPLVVGIMDVMGQAIAVAWVTPIVFKRIPLPLKGFPAFNLSYAVHSEHEGRGMGSIAASEAITAAQLHWAPDIDSQTILNIQTRQDNVASIALAQCLGATLHGEASFTVELPTKEVVVYVGFRMPWEQALAWSRVRLGSIDEVGAAHYPTLERMQ